MDWEALYAFSGAFSDLGRQRDKLAARVAELEAEVKRLHAERDRLINMSSGMNRSAW